MEIKINISEEDIKNLKDYNVPLDNNKEEFYNVVVNKPWGYEYLMFQNEEVAIWMLYLKKGFCTSMHCHPSKKTSLLVLSGEAKTSTLNKEYILKEKENLIIEKGVFHRTEALSENGIFVIEVETPVNKRDLYRLKDEYHRAQTKYTSKENITNKLYNYHYLFIKDERDKASTFGKYKFEIKEVNNSNQLKEEIEKNNSKKCIILKGEIKINEDIFSIGDTISIIKEDNIILKDKIRILFLNERKNLKKLSDFVIDYLAKRDIRDVFLVTGGNIMHLTESIRKNPLVNYICNHHEQAATMCADAYARLTKKTGFALVTSGPGGTNSITGVACAWVDSIPMLVISGQSYDNQTIGTTGLRQLGVQEMNITEIVKPITKYAIMVRDPKKIKYHLDEAMYHATNERSGPVWIDIPINIQLTEIEVDELEEFVPPKKENNNKILKEKVKETIEILNNSKRPMIILGNGVRLANAEREFFELVEKLKIPIVTTRNANDIIWDAHELYVGRIGSFGQRYSNFAIQNSDVVLAIGSRIALAVTGWAYKDFAREAKKIVVDIDKAELKKPTINVDIPINSDAKEFILEMLNQLNNYHLKEEVNEWKEKIKEWKTKYPIVLPEYKEIKDSVNTYYFLEKLSEKLTEEDVIVTDMGMSFQCTMQTMKLKKGEKLFTASGMAPMGYGLPGAIGACLGNNKKRVICITGDGGLQMNIQEMATIAHNNLPIKIFILNNNGYSAIRETQKMYFKELIGSDTKSGVSMPNFTKIGEAYGIKTIKINNHEEIDEGIKKILEFEGPMICDIKVSEDDPVMPKQGAFNRPDGKTVPRPIEDMLPYLEREVIEKEMIIESIPFDPYKKEENGT